METMDDDTLSRGAAALGLALTKEQRALFGRYYALLIEHNEAVGLTTVVDAEGVLRRHFLESLALIPALQTLGALPPGARIVDLGAGGGFPGLPLAIALPGVAVTLVESHGRRARFLADAAAELDLADRVSVIAARAEDAGRMPDQREAYDIAVARALAALPVLVELALPFVRVGGLLAAIKGSRAAEEIVAAAEVISVLGGDPVALLPLPGGTSEHPPVLAIVRKSRPTPERFPRRAGVPQRRPLGHTSNRP